MTRPFDIHRPGSAVDPVPVILDSPHSGTDIPADFDTILAPEMRQRGEDAFVDVLFSAAPRFGASLLVANFPRLYIDPNRAEDDVDPADFAGDWQGPANPGPRTARGTGLIWTRLHGVHPLYGEPLPVAAVEARIEGYWRPYHRALAAMIDDTHATFGRVYHLNCHSMRACGNRYDDDGPVVRPDFVLGNRDGVSCEPAFTERVAAYLRQFGYSVAINRPYKGAELVRRYADPGGGRHSLQIEINRGLYMDEVSREKSAGFEALRERLTGLVGDVTRFAVDRRR